jgi:hypothetical protein
VRVRHGPAHDAPAGHGGVSARAYTKDIDG